MSKKKIVILVLVLVTVPFVTIYSYNFLIRRDLDAICDEYKNALANPIEDKAEEAYQISKNISAQTYMPSIKIALSAIASADNRSKYSLMLGVAEELGYESWSCPEYQEYLSK